MAFRAPSNMLIRARIWKDFTLQINSFPVEKNVRSEPVYECVCVCDVLALRTKKIERDIRDHTYD